MNSDCSSYVMICLCIGVAYDCVSGTGEANRKGCTHIRRHTNNFFLPFFFSLISVFLSLVMVTGRGHTTSANPCEEKKRPSIS